MSEFTPPDRVLIVGASLAGLRTAEGLRSLGHEGAITLVGAEPHPPYTRPPLSKQVLAGDWKPEKALLRSADKLAELDLDLLLGTAAASLDTDRAVVTLDDGRELSYDAVVIATGAAPRRLPGAEGLDGVHVLRTIEDSLAIREGLARQPRVVVVGAGFIGAEVAAVAAGRGLDVTVLEGLEAPMVRGLGPELGAVAGALQTDHGVDLRCGVAVEGFEGDRVVEGVILGDGSTVPADLVVVGIGVLPNTEWLEGSGLQLDTGVVCDETLAAVGVEGVWAAGDLARWHHPSYGELVRFEHWTVAADHGHAVATNVLAAPGEAHPHDPLPYVWSDQYATKIQIVGRGSGDDDVEVVRGSYDERRFVAVQHRDGEVTAAVGFSSPRHVMQLMMRMEEGPLSVETARQLVSG